MSILVWLVLGLVVGYVLSRIVNTSGEGLLRDILIGIGGALVGGSLFTTLGSVAVIRFSFWSLIVALVGAVVALLVYHGSTDRSRL